jgi:hypothetical protein
VPKTPSSVVRASVPAMRIPLVMMKTISYERLLIARDQKWVRQNPAL